MLRLWIKNNSGPVAMVILAYVCAGLLGWGWHKELLLGFLVGALAFGRYEHPDLFKNAEMLRISVNRFLNIYLRAERSDLPSERLDAIHKEQHNRAKLMQYWFLKFDHTQIESLLGRRPSKDDRAFFEKVEREVIDAFGTTDPNGISESGATKGVMG